MQRRQALSAIVVAFCCLAATAVNADTVKTDYNHNFNFSSLHTYSWGEVKTANPFYVDRVKQEIDKDLQAKGWQLAPTGGDVTIFARGNINNQQELETYYNGFGGGWGGRWGWGGWGWGGPGFGSTTTVVSNQPIGNLVVDIFNGSSKELIWRGMSQRDLSKNDNSNAKALNSDIDKMLKGFPLKSKG